MNINILSANVRGLNDPLKINKIFSYFHNSNHDLMFLQETKLKSPPIISFPGQGYFSSSDTSSAGVGILLKSHFQQASINHIDNRIIILTIKTELGTFGLINLYGPNTDPERVMVFETLHNQLGKFTPTWDSYVLAGDFNLASSHHRIHDLLTHFPLKLLCNSNISFTFQNTRSSSLIDHIFVSNDLSQNSTLFIGPKFSDHYSLIVNINLSKLQQFPFGDFKYWKLNKNLLFHNNELDPDLIQLISKCESEIKLLTKFPIAITSYWDFSFKFNISKYLMNKGKILAKIQGPNLEKQLQFVTNQIQKTFLEIKEFNQPKITRYFHPSLSSPESSSSPSLTPSSPPPLPASLSSSSPPPSLQMLNQKLLVLNEERDNLQNKIFQKLSVKLKIQNIDKEKPTKWFFGLEKIKKKETIISQLLSSEGITLDTPESILEEVTKFYNKLYNQPGSDTGTTYNLFTHFSNSLTDIESQTINNPITLEELVQAIDSTFPNGSPGIDGLTYEFYKSFSPQLSQSLLLTFNTILSSGGKFFPNSFLHSLIKPIKKPSTSSIPSPEDFRPISLTNSDFKLFSKIITKRLNSMVDKLISHNQHGLPSRYIADAINSTLTNNSGTGLFVDFKKAFDSIKKNYLTHLIQQANLGNIGQVICNLFLSDQIQATVSLNGYLSSPFTCSNGVRQGDPISPFLFCFGLDPLLKVLSEKKIDSIAYMDDLTVFIKNQSDLDFTLKILDKFWKISGLKINSSKSFFFPSPPQIPSTNPSTTTELPSSPPSADALSVKNPATYLGITLATNPIDIHQSWMDKLQKSENIINSWKKHKLSLKGKTLIWNSLIISRFIHIGLFSDPPALFYSQLDYLLKTFLWEKKTHLLSVQKLNLPISKGGLNLINLRTHLQVLKLNLLKRMVPRHSFRLAHSPISSFPPASSFFLTKNLAMKISPPPQINIRTSAFKKPSLPPHYLSLWSALSSTPFDTWPKDNKEARWLIDKHALGEVPLYYEDLDPGYTKAFAGLWKVPVPQKWNQTFFLFLHRALPLSDRLHVSSLSNCHLCHAQGILLDHRHVFLSCPFSLSLLSSSLLSLHKPQPNLTRFILRGGRVFSPNDVPLQKLHRYWMNIVWRSHSANFFQNGSVSSHLLTHPPSLSFMISSFLKSL